MGNLGVVAIFVNVHTRSSPLQIAREDDVVQSVFRATMCVVHACA